MKRVKAVVVPCIFLSCFKYEFSHVTGSVPCLFLYSFASAHEPGRTQIQAGRGEGEMGVICKDFVAGKTLCSLGSLNREDRIHACVFLFAQAQLISGESHRGS